MLEKHLSENARKILDLLAPLPTVPQPERTSDGNAPVPRKIWMFWHDGLENAPDIVRKSHLTWQTCNPDHEVSLLSLRELDHLLGVDFEKLCKGATAQIGWAGRSDLIRLVLLCRFGGYWADATTFCLRPLDRWLDIDAAGTGFFSFRELDSDEPLPLIVWLLAAARGSPLIADWLELAVEYLFRDREVPLELGVRLPGEAAGAGAGAHRPGMAELERLARFGKLPYLWIKYLFNDVAAKHPTTWQAVQKLNNDYIRRIDPPHGIRWVSVAKHSYRANERFVRSPNYKARCNWVFDGERMRSDLESRRKEFLRVGGWRDVRPSLQISERRKLFFIHIPKCGGTSVDNSALFGPPKRAGHATLSVFRGVLGPRIHDFRCLVMVRNPWDRLASAFRYLDAGGGNPNDAAAAETHLKVYGGNFDLFLDDFATRPRHFFNRLVHFRPAVAFFRPSACPVPYHLQKLEEVGDLAAVRAFLGMPDFTLGHERKGPANASRKPHFSQEAFDRVAEIYREDIRTFGYSEMQRRDLRY